MKIGFKTVLSNPVAIKIGTRPDQKSDGFIRESLESSRCVVIIVTINQIVDRIAADQSKWTALRRLCLCIV